MSLKKQTPIDLHNKKDRDNVVIECAKQGLLVLGAGDKSIRVIPPYIIKKEEAEEGLEVIENSIKSVREKGFKHKGEICKYMGCGESSS